jgi:hypothetical protein
MTKLKPNDKVDCRVKSYIIVSPYKDYDEIKTFQIIGTDAYGYYLYVPEYYVLKNTQRADRSQCRHLGIDYKFMDEQFIYISGDLIARVNTIFDGIMCRSCKEFFQMAEPTNEDGTLICYSCRQSPYR